MSPQANQRVIRVYCVWMQHTAPAHFTAPPFIISRDSSQKLACTVDTIWSQTHISGTNYIIQVELCHQHKYHYCNFFKVMIVIIIIIYIYIFSLESDRSVLHETILIKVISIIMYTMCFFCFQHLLLTTTAKNTGKAFFNKKSKS